MNKGDAMTRDNKLLRALVVCLAATALIAGACTDGSDDSGSSAGGDAFLSDDAA